MFFNKNIITSDDILGKDAVDPEGEIIGVVQKLHIDKEDKNIVGITIDEGFMKPDLFVGIDLIRTFGVDSILLKKSPVDKIKGLRVFDPDGKDVGFVASVIKGRSNNVKGIVVKNNILGKNIMIDNSEIKQIGFNVILKRNPDKIKQE